MPRVERKKVHYTGSFSCFETVEVKYEDGAFCMRDRVHISDGVGVLPFLDAKTVLLARQFRTGPEKEFLELIQGGIDPGESPQEAALRELLEETGYRANTLVYMTSFYGNPTILSAEGNLFVADGLERIDEPRPQPGERLELVEMNIDTLVQLIKEGKVPDGHLQSAVLYWQAFLRNP